MSDRLPQRQDNYGDDGETPRDRQQTTQTRGDRTAGGDRTTGGCCCGGGGGCCCHMRSEAYDRSDPLREQRHREAKAHMEAEMRLECPQSDHQSVPRHRQPTHHDQVCDPDHHIRHHRRHHHQNTSQYGEYGPTGADRPPRTRVPIPNQNGVDYSGDNYTQYGNTNGSRYRVIDGAPNGGNVYYDEQGRAQDYNGRAINTARPPEQIVGTDRYGRAVDQYGRVVGQADMENMVVDYDQQGRPLDKYGRVLTNGANRQETVVGYDQYGRAVDQYGRVIGGAVQNQNQQYDQYGRPVDQYGRIIGSNAGVQYDQYGRPCDQYGRVIGGVQNQQYDQYGRPVDQYGRVIGSNAGVQYDQYGRAVDQYGRVIGGAVQNQQYDQYGRAVDQYGRVIGSSQIVGYDTYGRPVDQYGRVVSGAGNDPWQQQRNNSNYYATQEWYRHHPHRRPWDEQIPGVYNGNYSRDGVYVGIGPNGQLQAGIQTDGVSIGVGNNRYPYNVNTYPYRSGEDYNDYYGQYLDPNGRGGRYYRTPVQQQIVDYSYYNEFPRYDSRYAYRHGNGVDIGAVLPIGNGGAIGIDLNNITRLFR